jgi:hypothetical protein
MSASQRSVLAMPSDQIGDAPAAIPRLDVLERKRRHLRAP